MRLGLGLGVRNSGFVGGYDSATSAFLAATGITSKTESDAVNNLVIRLKSYGLWSKMKAIYPFVSDTVNLLSYTEDFTNASWTKNNITVTGNTTTAPDGTSTADSIFETAVTNLHFTDIRSVTTTIGQIYTASVYLKANGRNFATVGVGAEASYACFDLANGTVGLVTGTCTPSISSVGNGWYRCSVTMTIAVGSTTSGIFVACQNANQALVNYAGDITKGVFIWGGQMQLGSLTTYQPIATTPANRFVSQFKYNLKDARDLDAAFRLAFNGTWTYSKQGATPNGVNAYADTYYLESANATLNSGHISYYSRTNIAGNPFMGASNGTTETNIYPNNGGTFYPRIQATNSGVPSVNLNAAAYFIASRINATEVNGYRNTTKYTVSNPTVSLNNLRRYYLGAGNDSTIRYNANQTAFSTIGDGLTDTEATNLYTSVQLFQQELSRYVGVPIVSDANAQAFLNAAVITDQTQANAVNTLVTDLKTYGLWTKMKAIYPFVGGTATTHKWNLKDPRDLDAAYRLAFSGAWTHSSTGALPNGANAYADSFLTPSGALSQNNTHISSYIRNTSTGVLMGCDSTYRLWITPNFNGSQKYVEINTTTTSPGTPISSATGLWLGNRLTSNLSKLFNNNTLNYSHATASAGLETSKVFISARNTGVASNYSSSQTAFSSIGDGLTDTEATDLYTAVQKYQTSLSRQV